MYTNKNAICSWLIVDAFILWWEARKTMHEMFIFLCYNFVCVRNKQYVIAIFISVLRLFIFCFEKGKFFTVSLTGIVSFLHTSKVWQNLTIRSQTAKTVGIASDRF